MICNCTKLILDKQSKCLVRSEAYALHKQKHTSGAGCGDEVCQVSQTRSRDLGATGPWGRQQRWLLGGWQVTWMKGQKGNGGVVGLNHCKEMLWGRYCGMEGRVKKLTKVRFCQTSHSQSEGKLRVWAVVHRLCPSTRSWLWKGHSACSQPAGPKPFSCRFRRRLKGRTLSEHWYDCIMAHLGKWSMNNCTVVINGWIYYIYIYG